MESVNRENETQPFPFRVQKKKQKKDPTENVHVSFFRHI